SSSAYKGILLFHSVGTGKCHAKDTPILMYDGSIKMVQDIEIGDLLMGDDSTPRRVLSLAQGTDEMYDIVPVKGDKYTVNSEHILVLKYNSFGITKNHKRQPNTPYRVDYFDNKKISKLSKSFKTIEEAVQFLNKYKSEEKRIVEIPVNKFINLAPSLRRELRGFRKGVDFVHKELPLDPYFIGVWLGDGGSRTSKFTTADPEILEYMTKEVEKFGLNVKHEKNYDYIISGNGKVGNNFIINTLRRYNLLNNKHIPTDYLINSRENRLKLLAGLIDTDGYYDIKGNVYEITQKSNVLADGILFLARSLGFAAYLSKCKKGCMYKGVKKEGIYNRIHISGDIEEIPVILPRKKANKRGQIKDVLVTGITVNSIGKGQYYGFTLDGNNRYLLGDFTVTHNTCSAIATATNSFEREGYTILW
ncbi:MAG: Hint domain-containing homing endonuclease, partial [Ilumatobacteraceae bacterium]